MQCKSTSQFYSLDFTPAKVVKHNIMIISYQALTNAGAVNELFILNTDKTLSQYHTNLLQYIINVLPKQGVQTAITYTEKKCPCRSSHTDTRKMTYSPRANSHFAEETEC